MEPRELITRHYSGADLADTLLGALAAHGLDPAAATTADLAPLDQLHAGSLEATDHVLARLGMPVGRLLDVGCGLGGPARHAAATYDGTVVGVDLSPDFVAAGRELTERVGLAGRVELAVTAADALPYEDAGFDAAMMIHVGMNLPDKAAVFAEVHRVLVPGAPFAVFDQMRVGPGDLAFPLPWAEDERSSFVESPEDYERQLREAGFTIEESEDRTSTIMPPPPGGLGPADVFGEAFLTRIGHDLAALREGRLAARLVLARA